ncbi:MAG: CarD family transcriptional regulator [Clostridiales bacterium]|nr:CarD family transcriptional regulator [Clostridiales bacterium]
MEFKVGDNVVYGGNGVCKITEIKEMSVFSGAPLKKYFVLEPIFTKQSSVMYVPLDSEVMLAKIHPVIDKEEALSLIKELPNNNIEWIEDKNLRKDTFNTIVTKGTRMEIMGVIKAVISHQAELVNEGKRLNMQDEKTLTDAKNRMNAELALALDLQPDEVPEFIRKEIKIAI